MVEIIFRGRVVGRVEVGKNGGNVYITKRYQNHYMRIFHGFGISLGLIRYLMNDFNVKNTKIVYESPTFSKVFEFDINEFLSSNQVWTDRTDRGIKNDESGQDDVQKFISLNPKDIIEIEKDLPALKKKEMN